MALKTINADGSVAMTAAAEMFIAADAWRIRRVTDMTVDAFIQAVLFVTDTLVHRFITLVEDILHMVLAHVRGGFYTALCFTKAALGSWYVRQQACGHG